MIQEVVQTGKMVDLLTERHHYGEVGSGASVVQLVVQLVQMNPVAVGRVMGHQELSQSDTVGM